MLQNWLSKHQRWTIDSTLAEFQILFMYLEWVFSRTSCNNEGEKGVSLGVCLAELLQKMLFECYRECVVLLMMLKDSQ